MSERRTPMADWVVPAIIVGAAVALILVVGIVIALVADDQTESSGLAHELDVYTSCLADHGANVPLVEARRDGGFSVTVPGSLVDGEVDATVWREAYDQCSDVAPDLFGGLLGGLSGGLLDGLMGGFPEGVLHDI
jgi:hypothetical protein